MLAVCRSRPLTDCSGSVKNLIAFTVSSKLECNMVEYTFQSQESLGEVKERIKVVVVHSHNFTPGLYTDYALNCV